MKPTIIQGDCMDIMPTLEAGSANTCVTSPPYWGLRDYGIPGRTWANGWHGALGLEPTPESYIDHMVEVFGAVRRVLRDDGTLWLNLGDSYLKSRNLAGIPWRVALALQADGWCLRQDIIWHKTNPMPESTSNRCTKAHEYFFLLSKSADYYWNKKAVLEPALRKGSGNKARKPASARGVPVDTGGETNGAVAGSVPWEGTERNPRSVWPVAVRAFKGAHFAVFPPDLIRPCIRACCPPGGTVLEPFLGTGTTAEVARENGCHCIGIELNPDYHKFIGDRLQQDLLPMSEVDLTIEAITDAMTA